MKKFFFLSFLGDLVRGRILFSLIFSVLTPVLGVFAQTGETRQTGQTTQNAHTAQTAQNPQTAEIRNIAVLDISGSFKDFTREDLSAIASRFETELQKTGKVQVLERRNMDLILQEQGFQQSGACNTSECQVEVGQLLGVDRIITGSITKVDKLYTLNMKMVDVGSGKNKMSHALDIRGSLEDVLRGGCYELAQIFAGLKNPEDSHTVLTAEKSSVWPWVVGGLGLVGAGIASWVILTQDQGSSDDTKCSIVNGQEVCP